MGKACPAEGIYHLAPIMTIYDITRTISPTLSVWPGDAPFSYDHVLTKSSGSSVNLTTLHLSAHTGTHADAPYHYLDGAEHPADLPLEKYIGPAHVVSITRQHGGITPDDFAGKALDGIQRLLIHTWVSALPDGGWPQDFPYPTVELIEWLAGLGVVLFGVDMPSVDSSDSKTLDCHHRLYHYGIVNLETLMLNNVPDGAYELIALPLKLAGVCGSPLRAILRTLS
jgi:arylformamidase